MKRYEIIFLLVVMLFPGCGKNPVLSMLTEKTPDGGGGGGGSYILSLIVDSDTSTSKTDSGTLTAPIGSTIQITWQYSGVSDTTVNIIVKNANATLWSDSFPSSYTAVTYGIDPEGKPTVAGQLNPGTYTVYVYLGHGGGTGFLNSGLGKGTITITSGGGGGGGMGG